MTRRKEKNQTREEKIKPKSLSGKTENQKDYIRSIVENDVVFCSGPAGSGKSYIASGMAANKLYDGIIEQIIVSRPMVCAGEDIGALPGDVNEKIMPHLKPMEENLKHFLGRVYYGQFFNDNRIRYEPLELMRGATFNNAYMILDEAQNCTIEQIKMFITRMGTDSKVIINGDTNQTDLSGRSGLSFCMNKLANVEGVGSIKLTNKDIQRNGIIGRVLTALENKSGSNGKADRSSVLGPDYDDGDVYEPFSRFA